MNGYDITRRPSGRSAAVPGVAGTFAVLAAAGTAPVAALVVAAGVVVTVVGVWTGRHGTVDAGGLVALLGLVVGAFLDGGAVPVVLGATATVVTWDAGNTAVSLGRQLGRRADTLRVEVLGALVAAVVGVAGAVGGTLLFVLGPRGQPVTTLFVLLLAAAALVAALNR